MRIPYYTLLYVFLIVFINWAFSWAPHFDLPDGGKWTPFAVVTGMVFVVRDFAQREIGHYIFIPLIVGAVISYFMAYPAIAIASSIAFAASEAIDWCVYTFSKKPLSSRILISSAFSVPVDTVVFLIGANIAIPGMFSWLTVLSVIVSKMVGAYVVYRLVKRRERLFVIGNR